jgi:hypothetical protein
MGYPCFKKPNLRIKFFVADKEDKFFFGLVSFVGKRDLKSQISKLHFCLLIFRLYNPAS